MKKEIKEKIKDWEKEFDGSEFVKREYGEGKDFINVIAEGTIAERIKSFIRQLLSQQKQKLVEEIENKIIKEFTESQRCLNCGLLKKNWQGDLSSWCDDCLENE